MPERNVTPGFGIDAGLASGQMTVDQAVRFLSGRLNQMTMYQLLGVTPNATAADIRNAFIDRARRLHPDQVVRSGNGELRPLAERVFQRITEAHSVLSDPQRRAQYDASLNTGGQGGLSEAESVLQAEQEFKRGEGLLAHGDVVGAERAFAAAAQAGPDELEYRMMLLWTRWLNPSTHNDSMLTELARVLEQVARERPKLARPHLLLGQLWRQRNDATKAEQAFAAALRVDPNNLDAARELRLLEMRKRKK